MVGGAGGAGGVEWRWDVALSYASAQRAYVEQVAAALKARGVRCFYDADEQVELWGRCLAEELPRVYAVDAAVVVVFVSAEYAARDWTNVERRAALKRAAAQRREYLLPARFDDTRLPGLRADLVAVDLRHRTPGQFAEMVAAKLSRLGLTGAPRRQGGGWPEVSNLPSRLATFTGRGRLLEQVRDRLHTERALAVVQASVAALHGLGGVGKTQLAIEYCYRYAGDYDVVWWVEAEQAALLPEKVAALGLRLGLATTGSVDLDAAAVLDALRRRDRWLLVFDNAVRAADIRRWVPGGPGHVLVTSRNPVWGGLAGRIAIDVLPRAEAVALLCRRVPGLGERLAGQLAGELGDLPLALEQAAAYLERTEMPPETYLQRFQSRRAGMLALGEDLAYRGTVDTAWSLTLAQLEHARPAAAVLLQLCALLAPEPIPLGLFTAHSELLPEPLHSAVAGDPAAGVDEQVAAALGYSMCRRHGDTVQVHRLVQAVISSRLPPGERAGLTDTARRLLAAAAPPEATDPETWPRWSLLGPHLLAAGAALETGDDPHRLRQAVDLFCRHLYARGDYKGARQVETRLLAHYRGILGPDHPDTLSMANNLSVAVRELDDDPTARELNEDTLARCRRVLGHDHPATLRAANDVAVDLTEDDPEASRDLHLDNLARSRRVLGDGHIRTLNAANNLARTLRELGDFQAAVDMDRKTLAGFRALFPGTCSANPWDLAPHTPADLDKRSGVPRDDRIFTFPENHPTVLTSISNIAEDLFGLGENEEARRIHEEVLARRRIYLGTDHPYTLRSAAYLARVLRALGDTRAARELGEDTLERRRRVLGAEHKHTLQTARELAGDLRALGEDEAAHRVEDAFGLHER